MSTAHGPKLIVRLIYQGWKWVTWLIWVTWDTFWRVKWVSSANLIIWMWPGYYMFFRKQCKWVNFNLGLMNALKYHWCKTSLYMWCPKISALCKGLVLYSAKNEETYGIFPYQNFLCHVIKKKTSTCGSQVGHIRIVLWVKWVNSHDPLSWTLTSSYHLRSREYYPYIIYNAYRDWNIFIAQIKVYVINPYEGTQLQVTYSVTIYIRSYSIYSYAS